MSYNSMSQEQLIKIKFPDGKLDWVQSQNDLRNLKLKICCKNSFLNQELIRIPFDCVVILNTRQEIVNAQEFKNFEIGHEYEVIDLRQLLGSHKSKSESQYRELQILKQQSQTEITFLNNKVQQLEQYIESINNQQNSTGLEWQNKYNSLFQDNQKSQNTIQALGKQIDELNIQLYQKNTELEEAQSQSLALQFEIEEQQVANERLITRLHEQKDELKTKDDELENKNKELNEYLKQYNSQIYQNQQETQQINQYYQQEIASYYQKIEDLEATIVKNQDQHQSELKKVKNEKKKVNDDLNLKVEEISILTVRLEKQNQELKDKSNIIERLKSQNSESELQYEQNIIQLNNEIDNLKLCIQQYKNKVDKALSEIKLKESTIDSLQQSQNPQSQVIDNESFQRQNYKIQQYQDKIDDLELQIQTNQQKVTKLELKLSQLTQENKLKDLKISSLQQNIEDLTTNLKEAEKQVKVEKENLLEYEKKQKLLTQEKLKEKEDEINTLVGKNLTIQIQLNKKDKDILELQNNVTEVNQKLSDTQKMIKQRNLINNQMAHITLDKEQIDQLIICMTPRCILDQTKKIYRLKNIQWKINLSANLFTKDTIQLKFQVFKVVLELNQLKQKIYQDSNLEFTNCYSFIPQGEIDGLRTKTRIMESNVDRIFFYNCTSGILQNQVLVIRELIKIPQNKDQEFQYMITQGGGSAVAQFLLEEFYQLLHDSKDKIAHYNSLSAQKIVIPDKLQFQEQLILKLHDDATNTDRYYNASIINVQLKNNRYDFIRYNGGHKFTNNSDFAVFLQVFSYFTIWKTNRQLAVTYIQGIENQFFDPIVSTFDGFFNVLDQGNLEIKTFESLFRSTKNNYKGEQLLKCLGII
ncbi:hypothetical protein pb186bvf_007762 [Paramecium bursaria]